MLFVTTQVNRFSHIDLTTLYRHWTLIGMTHFKDIEVNATKVENIMLVMGQGMTKWYQNKSGNTMWLGGTAIWHGLWRGHREFKLGRCDTRKIWLDLIVWVWVVQVCIESHTRCLLGGPRVNKWLQEAPIVTWLVISSGRYINYFFFCIISHQIKCMNFISSYEYI